MYYKYVIHVLHIYIHIVHLMTCSTHIGIEQEGSNLSGVSGFVHWEEVQCQQYGDNSQQHSDKETPQLSATGKCFSSYDYLN